MTREWRLAVVLLMLACARAHRAEDIDIEFKPFENADRMTREELVRHVDVRATQVRYDESANKKRPVFFSQQFGGNPYEKSFDGARVPQDEFESYRDLFVEALLELAERQELPAASLRKALSAIEELGPTRHLPIAAYTAYDEDWPVWVIVCKRAGDPEQARYRPFSTVEHIHVIVYSIVLDRIEFEVKCK